ncbi:MAG TPA: hypothetical protein VMC08_05525 [Bacteroidales bacterium]|nr:hypothetical protein [Bacteroidales bacterium]
MKKMIFITGIVLLLSGITVGQVKTSMAVKDLNSSITKYIKKNYVGYKSTEAFKYDICYEINIVKGTATEGLVFDSKGKFLTKRTADIIPVRTRSTIALKDVNNDIQKYIKKNYDGYKITEAYLYDLAYSVKINKENASETLLFDKDGNFEKKLAEPAGMKETPKKADSVPAKQEEKKK